MTPIADEAGDHLQLFARMSSKYSVFGACSLDTDKTPFVTFRIIFTAEGWQLHRVGQLNSRKKKMPLNFPVSWRRIRQFSTRTSFIAAIITRILPAPENLTFPTNHTPYTSASFPKQLWLQRFFLCVCVCRSLNQITIKI